jgi:Immunoglobulin-like domain of bacterial spore germination/Sporulation and spore germination
MKRLSLAVILIGVLGAACAGGASSLGAAPSGPATSPPTSPSATPSPVSSPTQTTSPTPHQTVTLQVWFAYGDKLFLTRRIEPFDPGVAQLALTALLAGPTDAERAAGLRTAIPTGTRLRGLNLAGGVLTVDLSSEYGTGGGSLSVMMRLAQVVYTATQFSTVKSVAFQLEGRPVTAFTGQGVVLDKPQGRGAYDQLLPAILVQTPIIGQRVSSPVVVSGTADVFEATVSLRILDENGTEIARTFTQATCGTGCRGNYSVSVSYTVDHEQPGTVEVFETSMKDGSALHVVKIPVTLTT